MATKNNPMSGGPGGRRLPGTDEERERMSGAGPTGSEARSRSDGTRTGHGGGRDHDDSDALFNVERQRRIARSSGQGQAWQYPETDRDE